MRFLSIIPAIAAGLILCGCVTGDYRDRPFTEASRYHERSKQEGARLDRQLGRYDRDSGVVKRLIEGPESAEEAPKAEGPERPRKEKRSQWDYDLDYSGGPEAAFEYTWGWKRRPAEREE